jgi:EAL domain-containing protein (putative c-di-GMP-specific phosphodiesterase class I)
MRTWLDDGLPLQHVGVNLSAADFRKGGLRDKICRVFEDADVPLDHLILEVTESVYLGQRDHVVADEIKALRLEGLKVALDDFGTGYASLRHLKEFPVDIVKIDRSFVRDMEDDPNDEAIIRAVVNLGKNLNISVVAEGIERMSQAERLIEIGCDFGQGFLFSEAIPADRIPPLVASFAGRSKTRRRPALISAKR